MEMTFKVTIVVGNPKPMSRTLKIAELLVQKLLKQPFALEIIDLADHTGEIFKWPSEQMERLNAQVEASDLIVVASPTYKATYTGLLKAFLDRYATNALRGVVAIPVMTGADSGHSLAPAVSLGPLLAELGASVPFRGFYFALSSMPQLEELVDAAVADYASAAQALQTLIAQLPDKRAAA
jgi:FMN reductase